MQTNPAAEQNITFTDVVLLECNFHIYNFFLCYICDVIDMQVLNLGENRIQALFGDTFVYMRSLRALQLDNNGLGFVYERAFNGLHSLLSLALNHNRIRYVNMTVVDRTL